MATLPAVDGLAKHQLYFRDPTTGNTQGVVMTLWTWRNEDPVPAARVTYEQEAIAAWAVSASMVNKLADDTWATFVKTWDFGTTPPTKKPLLQINPTAPGTNGAGWAPQLGVVIALRTQPVGSIERNRQNGRIFHPYPPVGGVTNGLNSNGQWNSTFRGEIEAAYTELLDALTLGVDPDAGQWVVPCHWLNGALRPGGPLLPAVDHVIARPQPGVRRSRQGHPGPYALGS